MQLPRPQKPSSSSVERNTTTWENNFEKFWWNYRTWVEGLWNIKSQNVTHKIYCLGAGKKVKRNGVLILKRQRGQKEVTWSLTCWWWKPVLVFSQCRMLIKYGFLILCSSPVSRKSSKLGKRQSVSWLWCCAVWEDANLLPNHKDKPRTGQHTGTEREKKYLYSTSVPFSFVGKILTQTHRRWKWRQS